MNPGRRRGVPDYDVEAAEYDRTRGGVPRARAAARAVDSLLHPAGVVLDVAGGTGLVAAQLAVLGHRPVVLDGSAGMLAQARGRLPGRLVRADAAVLPIRSGTCDAVVLVWVLHLLTPPARDALIAEAARVLRPGGRLVTTVDKARSHGYSDEPAPTDHPEAVAGVASLAGCAACGSTTFIGHGQGDPPPRYPLLAFERTTG